MQINALTVTPSVGPNCPQRTLSSMQFGPTMEMGYYRLQQESSDQHSARSSHLHAFSQPVSTSCNSQSVQTPHNVSRRFQSHAYHSSPFQSHSPPNIVPYEALHVGLHAVNLRHDRQALNTCTQRNYKDLHCMQNGYDAAPRFSFPPVHSNANGVSEISYCMYNSVSPWQHQDRVQTSHHSVAQSRPTGLPAQVGHSALTNYGLMGVIAPHTEAHRTAASRIPVDPFTSSQFRTYRSQKSPSHVQKAVHPPSPREKCAGYVTLQHSSHQTPPLPNRARWNSVVQNQSNQNLNQVSTSSSLDEIQAQTVPMSGHHSKTYSATIQGSTQRQYQSNCTGTEQTMNSQVLSSVSTSMSKTSSPTSASRSNKYFHSILFHHLLKDDDRLKLFNLTTFSKCLGSQVAKSITGHICTRENFTQDKVGQGKEYEEHAKETGISRGNEIGTGSQLGEPENSNLNETTEWKKRTKEGQSRREPADSHKPGISPLRMDRQVNKEVALVPPISRQVSFQGQHDDVTTSSQHTHTMETDTVKFLSKEKETNVPNVTCKLTEDLPSVTCSASSSLRLGSAVDTLVDTSEMATSIKVHGSGSRSCERGPVSATQITNQWQDSTSKSPAERNDKQEVEISSEENEFDWSTIPGVEYTLKELKDLVNSLEIESKKRGRAMKMNTMKSIIDMYFDGNIKNLSKSSAIIESNKSLSEFCIKEMHGVVLQYPEPKNVKMMKNISQIMTSESTMSSEDFTSSWLNVDGQPADVDTVLAEPMSEFKFTWCKNVAQSEYESSVHGVDSLAQVGTDTAEDRGVHASKGIPKTTADSVPDDTCTSDPESSVAKYATTDCNSDVVVSEKGRVRRTPGKFSRMQRKSKKPEDEVAMVTESRQELSEPSLTGSSDKRETNNSDVFEKTDSSSDEDSSDDFPEITVLSSEDARKIFSEYSDDDQKREPHQVYQKEKQVKSKSDSVHVKPFDDFKFTCPHVTGLASGGDSFCLTCWNETPLLDIDQDETPLTPKEGGMTTDTQSQGRSPWSGKPIKHQSAPVLESSSMINSEDLQRISSSAGTLTEYFKGKGENADSPVTAKVLTVSHPRNLLCAVDGVPEADDLLVSPDHGIKNTNTHKQHPSDHRSTSSDTGQRRNEIEKRLNLSIKKKCLVQLPPKNGLSILLQLSNIGRTLNLKTAAPQNLKRPIIEEKGRDFKSNEAKKVRLELYGSNSSNSNCRGEEIYSTPVYLTVSHGSSTGKCFTDKTSAKQEAYGQCRTSPIHPRKISSSHKKRQKNYEDELKSKIQMLKILLKERILAISQKQSSESRKRDQAEGDAG